MPQLVEELGRILHIEPVQLDNSEASVSLIERKVRRYGKQKTLDTPVFAGLVAYLGEIVRLKVNGRWAMYRSKQDDEVWEPWIVDPEGRVSNTWSTLYDMLAENEYGMALWAVVNAAVMHRTPPAFTYTTTDFTASNEDSSSDVPPTPKDH